MRITRPIGVATVVAVLTLSAPALGARQDLATESPQLAALVTEYLARAGAGGGGLARGLSPDRVDGLSLARVAREATWAAGLLGKVPEHPAGDAVARGFLTWSVLEFELRFAAEADRLFWLTIPITPYSSPLRGLSAPFSSFALRSPADADTYLDALNQVPVVIAAYLAKLRSQVQRGIVLPAGELRLVVPFVRTLIGTPAQSVFTVATTRLAALPADQATAFRQKVDETIRSTVNPALEAQSPHRRAVSRASASVGWTRPGGLEAHRTRAPHGLASHLNDSRDRLEVPGREADEVRARFADRCRFRTHLKTDRRFFSRPPTKSARWRPLTSNRRWTFLSPKPCTRRDAADESSNSLMTAGAPSRRHCDPVHWFGDAARIAIACHGADHLPTHPGHHFQIMLRREGTGSFSAGADAHRLHGGAVYSSDLASGRWDPAPWGRAAGNDLFFQPPRRIPA
jgi:hypothetical protein